MRSVMGIAWLALGLLGCDRVLGIEDLPAASAIDGGVDAPPPRKAACDRCTDACASARTACDADPACASTWDCLARCPLSDPMCRKGCEDAHPGIALAANFRAIDGCARLKCPDDCYGSGGLVAAIDGKCGCGDAGCRDKVAACVQSDATNSTHPVGSCERQLACIAAAANPDAYLACEVAWPTSLPAAKVLECARGVAACATDGAGCPLAQGEVACKGFKYGTTTASTTQLRFQIYVGSSKLPGATATACLPGSCATCVPAGIDGSVQTSDGDGYVTLTVPIAGGPLTGGGAYSGCIRVTPPADVDAMPTTIDTGRNVHVDGESELATFLWPSGFVDGLASQLVPPITPDYVNRAQVFGTAHDCLWQHLIGAQIALEPPVAPVVYLSSDWIADDQTQTGGSGAFAIFDLPPGKYTLTTTMNQATVDVHPFEVSAGMVLDANLFPQGIR